MRIDRWGLRAVALPTNIGSALRTNSIGPRCGPYIQSLERENNATSDGFAGAQMKRLLFGFVAVLVIAAAAQANFSPEAARKLYQEATPSLVAVQYAWVSELGRRELVGAGVVVGEDLVMLPITIVNPQIPDEQMK